MPGTAQQYLAESYADTYSIFRIAVTGPHTRTSVDSVTTVSAPLGANVIIFQAEGGTIRYTLDGSNPSASFGFRLAVADGERRLDLPAGAVLKFIGEASGFFVNYQWAKSLL